MPEISRFFGIIVAMFYNDHAPPHFHVRYGDQKAIIAIENLRIIGGELKPRAHALVVEWATLHQDELRQDWQLARSMQPLNAIAPLESIMLKDIIEVAARPQHKLFLRFEDGVTGEVDVARISNFAGVFAPLRDEQRFAEVIVNKELGTVQWPNGADLDPDVLYAMVSGKQVKVAA